MGEGVIDESKLPPEARKAYRAAQAMLKSMEITADYLEARIRVRRELPDGLARDIALETLRMQHQFQIHNLTRPRLNLEGGVVVAINQRDGGRG